MRYLIPVDEIIQLEIQKIKRFIGLTEDVICIKDKTEWKMLFPKATPNDVYGEAYLETGYFFLDLEQCETLRDIEYAIVHELLHLKHPKTNHKTIYKLARKYINGRY